MKTRHELCKIFIFLFQYYKWIPSTGEGDLKKKKKKGPDYRIVLSVPFTLFQWSSNEIAKK